MIVCSFILASNVVKISIIYETLLDTRAVLVKKIKPNHNKTKQKKKTRIIPSLVSLTLFRRKETMNLENIKFSIHDSCSYYCPGHCYYYDT